MEMEIVQSALVGHGGVRFLSEPFLFIGITTGLDIFSGPVAYTV